MKAAVRKKRLAALESEYRRTETALAIAQAEHEKSYATILAFMNEECVSPRHVLSFSPDITMH